MDCWFLGVYRFCIENEGGFKDFKMRLMHFSGGGFRYKDIEKMPIAELMEWHKPLENIIKNLSYSPDNTPKNNQDDDIITWSRN